MEHEFEKFSLRGKVAIVTGAGRGLGQSIALALSGAGAKVVLVSRTRSQLEETARLVKGTGGQAIVLPLDVCDEGAPEKAVQAAISEFGSIDILMYSAGVSVTKQAFEITRGDWERVMGTNLRDAFFWAQASAQNMLKTGGRIIFLSSVTAQAGTPWVAPYSASKGGIDSLTRALAVEWGQHNITVNAIAAGFIKTALTEAELSNERFVNQILKRTPLGRLGKPSDIDGAAIFLASDSSRYVSGHILSVEGGWLAT